MAPHSSTLASKIPWTEEPGRLRSMGSQRIGHDWATSLEFSTFPNNAKCQRVGTLILHALHVCEVTSVMSDPMYCSPPGSSVHGILQARILEWVVMPSSRGFSWPRDQTQGSCSSCIAGRFFTTEPPGRSWYQRSKSHIVPRIDEKDKWHISHLWSINRKSMLTHGQKSCLFHKCVLT